MAIRQYEVGMQHGREGRRFLEHRKGRVYDSANAQRSYYNGYYAGQRERRMKAELESAEGKKS
jgi:hypothetical protein